ncbi:polymorphic toxin-type HINT domain-containing protein [Longispora urticae]
MTTPLSLARRALCLLVAVTLALSLGVGPATADPGLPSISEGSTTDPAPLDPGRDYPEDLGEALEAFNEQLAAIAEQVQALAAAKQGLSQRSSAYDAKSSAHGTRSSALGPKITAHNNKVSAYNTRVDAHNARPHVFELPRESAAAAAYDAEKAQLDGEKAQLQAEEGQLQAEKSQLDAEAGQLSTERSQLAADVNKHNATASALGQKVRQLALDRQKLVRRVAALPPPKVSRPQGGDPARPPGRAEQGTRPAGNGGDSVSRRPEQAALDAYAKSNRVTVDRRPVSARLSPDAVSRLSAEEAARLRTTASYDGLVRKPNGNYRAVRVQNPGSESVHKPFDDAIRRGGRATTTVDGRKVTIDEVATVPGRGTSRPSCRTNSFTPGAAVLMADGSRVPIENVRIGDLVAAADPVTGESGPRRVTDLIVGSGTKQLVDVTVAGGGTVTATEGHPFWSVDRSRWVDAGELRVGEHLRGPDGAAVAVTGVRPYSGTLTVHNLTVAGLRTFYVLAGPAAVLTHNCDPDLAARTAMANTGLRPGRGGKAETTEAGLAYGKHQLHPNEPNNPKRFLPRVGDRTRDLDLAGQKLLDEIALHPKGVAERITGGAQNGGTRIVIPDGTGAVFDAQGNFKYFGKFDYTP